MRQRGRGWPDVSAVWARDLGEHWGALLPPRRAGGKRIRSAQQLGRLGDVGGDAPRLVAGEQLAAELAPRGLDDLTRLSGLGRLGARKIHVGR